MNAKQIIKQLGLRPHPVEGGYYLETYRSEEMIPVVGLPARYEGTRNFSTTIFYLLTPKTFSAIHRLPTDETFHFYLGDPVEMLHLFEDGSTQRYILGHDILNGHEVQLMVPRMVWQGCRLKRGGKYALMGCTVAPGFDFNDYKTARRDELTERYPHEKKLITSLTK
ncbi:MAG: cupin domain-containing protein [Candidatus Omnitrophota bacterium]